jgi:hypothetical protein
VNRYAVYDEDHELIRIFDNQDEAERFCLRNWTVEIRKAPPKRSPYEFALDRMGVALF